MFDPKDPTNDWPEGYLDSVVDFLSGDKDRESGRDVADEALYSNWLFPLQRRAELIKMMRVARKTNPQVVCEIGADKGAGVYQWLKCLPTIKKMIAIEPRGLPYLDKLEETFEGVSFLGISASSHTHSSISKVYHYLGDTKIDVLFIDGDKSAFNKDFDLYSPLVRSGGVIFLHDINQKGNPRDTFESIKKKGYRTEEIIDISDYEQFRDSKKPISCPYEGWLLHWQGKSCGVGVIYVD